MERALLAALARDRELFSDVFEASFAITKTTEHAYRFSYAFPGFRARSPSGSTPLAPLAPMAVASVASALACAAPFGPAVVAATRRLLRAATDPVVAQPLIGLAWDRAGSPRHKVYLQLHDRGAPSASSGPAFAERVLGMPGLAARIGDAHLHMLGVDFGPAGLTAAKLYIAHESLAATDPAAAPSATTLASTAPSATTLASAALGRALPVGHRVRNVLTVHRITPADVEGTATVPATTTAATVPATTTTTTTTAATAHPTVARLPPPSDVDFGLAESGLSWDEIAAAPEIAALLAGSRVASALFSGFRLGVRRISVGTGSALRLTVYYALREVEEP